MDAQIWDRLFFVALPYVSLLTFLLMTIYRCWAKTFSPANSASEFLPNKQHLRAVVLFRCGILIVALGHLLVFLLPQGILWWNGHLARLYILEVSAFAFGLLALASMVGLVIQRFTSSNIRVVTSVIDWILYAMLLMQVFTGVCVAVFYSWGSTWFASILSPYLWSVVRLSPDISNVATMPLLVKFHIICAFIIIGLVPLSRLVRILVIPNSCLRCMPRVVRWFGRKRRKVSSEG